MSKYEGHAPPETVRECAWREFDSGHMWCTHKANFGNWCEDQNDLPPPDTCPLRDFAKLLAQRDALLKCVRALRRRLSLPTSAEAMVDAAIAACEEESKVERGKV